MSASVARVVFLSWLVLMISRPVPAGAEMMTTENQGAGAEVTCLVGHCSVVTPDLEPVRALASGDRLTPGERLRVADGSKIELRLTDDSLVRLDAGSVVVIKSLSLDPATGLRFVDIGMIMGKLWAVTAASPSAEDRFDVSTRTAVISGRGAVFRMNVNDDQAAVVKVYDGAVEAKKASLPTVESAGDSGGMPPPQTATPTPDGTAPDQTPPMDTVEETTGSKKEAASPSAEPVRLDSDRPAAPQAWAYILEPGQELAIHADGTAAAPSSFSYDEDLTDWVKWNRERDGGK